MKIEEIIAEYVSLYDARMRIRELSKPISEWVKSDDSAHLTDEEVADMIGWELKTVTDARKPREGKTDREPSKKSQIPSLLSDDWEESEAVIARIALAFGWTEGSVKKVLREAHLADEIEAKGHKTRYMGNPGFVRTHFRRLQKSVDLEI